jgi:hypothetical protein
VDVEVCKSRLPLDVAVPSNWVTSACLGFGKETAKVSVPALPRCELLLITVNVPTPFAAKDSEPPVIESPPGWGEVIATPSL